MSINLRNLCGLTLIISLLLAGSARAAERPMIKDSAPGRSGLKQTLKGFIAERQPDSFTLRPADGQEINVILTQATRVEERKSNPFRSPSKYAATQLLRGLQVEVEGRREASGPLVAERIRFRHDDYMVARSVESTVVPVEQRVHQTESRLSQSEANAQRLSGQVEELGSISNAARGGAKAAQETADSAVAGVRSTHERISSLDEFVIRGDATVTFTVAKADLTPLARETLNDLVQQINNEKGFFLEVTGFASAEGNAEANRRLSRRRAEAVIRYLVEAHKIPLRRIITPHGYGAEQPVADNATRKGREQNRRVEVKILVNRGLTAPAVEKRTTSGL